MTERILIEEVLTLRKDALRSTVVRKENTSMGFGLAQFLQALVAYRGTIVLKLRFSDSPVMLKELEKRQYQMQTSSMTLN